MANCIPWQCFPQHNAPWRNTVLPLWHDRKTPARVESRSAGFRQRLSHIGKAVIETLDGKYRVYKGDEFSWNLRDSSPHKIHILQTPEMNHWANPEQFFADQKRVTGSDYQHSLTLPRLIGEDIANAKSWVDIVSLWPPDGEFATHIYNGIKQCAENTKNSTKPVVIRCIYANIPRVPGKGNALFDCDVEKRNILTRAQLSKERHNIKLHVGSWRKGTSWNHCKIIAVDGCVVFCGGHNILEQHYMHTEPLHDLSTRMEGPVAHDAHIFVNQLWAFIENNYRWHSGWCLPNWCPAFRMRVGLGSWPEEGKFPKPYKEPPSSTLEVRACEDVGPDEFHAAVIPCGRYGALYSGYLQRPGWYYGRPKASDAAIMQMLKSANTTIKISAQDLGPGQPCMGWPSGTLLAIGEAMIRRHVKVHMVLSHPHCWPAQSAKYLPGSGWQTCAKTAANIYGYGWTLEDTVVALIQATWSNRGRFADMKTPTKQLIEGMLNKLFVTYVKVGNRLKQWPNTQEYVAKHSKSLIVDDVCYYIGSQNLYNCNNTEWGVIVDSKEATQKLLEEYWNIMWTSSYDETEALGIRESVRVKKAANKPACCCCTLTNLFCVGCLPPPKAK